MTATAKKKKKKAVDKSASALQPLGDRLVVMRESSEGKTAGGIVLPDSARDKPSRGQVISVGNGKLLANGTRSPLQVKPGDRVLFTSYGPDEVNVGEKELLLMREDDVLAIIE